MDLNKNLLIFNVGSVTYILPTLTVCSQTELGLNIYGAVSDVRDGVVETRAVVADTCSTVSEVQRGVLDTHLVVADTHDMVSDIHRQMLGRQGGVDNRSQTVSDTRTISITQYMLTLAQTQTRSATSTSNGSSISHFQPARLVNHLLWRRGPVLDARS